MKVKELITLYQQNVIDDKIAYERQVQLNLHAIAYLDKQDPESEVAPPLWDDYELPPLTRLDDNNLQFPAK